MFYWLTKRDRLYQQYKQKLKHTQKQQLNDTKMKDVKGWRNLVSCVRRMCSDIVYKKKRHMINIWLALFWMKPIDHTFTSLFPVRRKYNNHTNQQKTTLVVGHFRQSTKHNDPIVNVYSQINYWIEYANPWALGYWKHFCHWVYNTHMDPTACDILSIYDQAQYT